MNYLETLQSQIEVLTKTSETIKEEKTKTILSETIKKLYETINSEKKRIEIVLNNILTKPKIAIDSRYVVKNIKKVSDKDFRELSFNVDGITVKDKVFYCLKIINKKNNQVYSYFENDNYASLLKTLDNLINKIYKHSIFEVKEKMFLKHYDYNIIMKTV